MTTPQSTRRANRRLLPGILAVALALRIIAAVALPDQHFPDAAEYREAGQAFWQTGGLGNSLVMPLYPVLVGLVGAGWGQLALDLALSTVTVWLVYRLTLIVFADATAALLGAFVTAIYPYFIFYAVAGLTETLFMALLIAAFLCWYGGWFTAAAILAVLSILTRPTIDVLVPLLIPLFAFFVHRYPLARSLRQLAAYVAIYCVMMSPWWLHNYRAYGTFVRLNLASGSTLYTGNNPQNRTGGTLDSDADMSFVDGISDPVARDRALWDAGIAFIEQHPGRFFELAGRKFVRFWLPWPYAKAYATPLYTLVSIASFVPVLALATLYVVTWGWQESPRVLPILLLIAYLTSIHVISVASLRYRLPLEPFLIVLAAGAAARLARGGIAVGTPGRSSQG